MWIFYKCKYIYMYIYTYICMYVCMYVWFLFSSFIFLDDREEDIYIIMTKIHIHIVRQNIILTILKKRIWDNTWNCSWNLALIFKVKIKRDIYWSVKLNWENTLYIKNGNCYLEIAKCLILLIELKSAVLKNKTSFNLW